MNQQTKDTLLKKINKLIEQTPLEENTKAQKWFWRENVSFTLPNEQYIEICKILLQKEGWSEKYSERYVDSKLQKLLVDIVKINDYGNTIELFDEFVLEYENYSDEQIVYVPLDGIQMSMDELRLGKVIFKKMTDNVINVLKSKFESIIDSLKTTDNNKEYEKKQQSIWMDRMNGRVSAEFHVIAEPIRAIERAEEETCRVLDLLKYAIPSIYNPLMNIAIGLQGEVSYAVRATPSIARDENDYHWESANVGSLHLFDLSPKTIVQMEGIGVFKISELLRKFENELSDFEKTLLRSLHWYASAQTQSELENKLLNLITCIEVLLTPRDSTPNGTFIAENIVILLIKDIEKRMFWKERILYIYKLRNAVSHGGEKGILESDVYQLQFITHKLINYMIDHKEEFDSRKALFDLLELKRLGVK